LAVKIEYKASVERDLRKLDRQTALRLVRRIESLLTQSPPPGTALSGSFAGLCRLRVGDYRVIYTAKSGGFLILKVGHRRDIYRTRPTGS